MSLLPNDTTTQDVLDQEPGAAEQATQAAVERIDGPDGPKYRLKVDGEYKEVDEAKLVTLAQKGWSADEKFRKASEIQKRYAGADQALQLADDIRRAHQGDADALQRVSMYLGYNEQQAAQIAADSQKARQAAYAQPDTDGQEPPRAPTGGVSGNDGGGRSTKLTVDDLPDEVKAILVQAQQSANERTRDQIFQAIDDTIDRDQRLGKLADRKSEGGVHLRNVVKEAVRRRVVLDGRQFGPAVIDEAIQEVAGIIKTVGTRAGTPQQQLGLGRGPGLDSSALHPAEQPKRVTSSDSSYRDYMLRRLQYDAMAEPVSNN